MKHGEEDGRDNRGFTAHAYAADRQSFFCFPSATATPSGQPLLPHPRVHTATRTSPLCAGVEFGAEAARDAAPPTCPHLHTYTLLPPSYVDDGPRQAAVCHVRPQLHCPRQAHAQADPRHCTPGMVSLPLQICSSWFMDHACNNQKESQPTSTGLWLTIHGWHAASASALMWGHQHPPHPYRWLSQDQPQHMGQAGAHPRACCSAATPCSSPGGLALASTGASWHLLHLHLHLPHLLRLAFLPPAPTR